MQSTVRYHASFYFTTSYTHHLGCCAGQGALRGGCAAAFLVRPQGASYPVGTELWARVAHGNIQGMYYEELVQKESTEVTEVAKHIY